MPLRRSSVADVVTSSGPFPLSVSANSRYWVGANGVPFQIRARAYWGIVGLDVSSRNAALDDLQTKAFNGFEMRAPNNSRQDNFVPNDGAGNLPFTTKLGGGSYTGLVTETPDFSTPNESYFQFLDALLLNAEQRNLLVLLFPAYIGYQSPATSACEGWGTVLVANGTTIVQNYGAYIANRYKARGNILWMVGGDVGTTSNPFHTGEDSITNALITGLKSVAGQRSTQYCAEWASGSYGDDQATYGSQLTANGVYGWEGQDAELANSGYQDTPTKPTFLLEEPYDEEGTDGTNKNGNAIQPTRKFVFRAVLNGANAGYCFGNGYLIHFFNGYTSHFSTANQNALAVFNAWMATIPWYDLIPHDVRNIITAGRGTVDTDAYVAGASTSNGAFAGFYAGPSFSSFTVDMTKFRGTVTVKRIDPVSGAQTSLGTFSNSSPTTQTFSSPGNNSGGQGDWLYDLAA